MNKFMKNRAFNICIYIFICILFIFLLLDCIKGKKGDDVIISDKISDEENEYIRYFKAELDEPKSEKLIIRVIIKTDNFSSIYHKSLNITLPADAVMTKNYDIYFDTKDISKISTTNDLNLYSNQENNKICDLKSGDIICIENMSNLSGTVIDSIKRNNSEAVYMGNLYIIVTDNGYVLINEVDFEDYLKLVVPSEMPPSYESEALKAQAICARTYAYKYLLAPAYPEFGANLDDSTSFQVYNNVDSYESTDNAVDETYGMIMIDNLGNPCESYFYSTSCGRGTNNSIWQIEPLINLTGECDSGELLKFMNDNTEEHFESDLPWYRWSYTIDDMNVNDFRKRMVNRLSFDKDSIVFYKNNELQNDWNKEINKFKKIYNIYVADRGAGGVTNEVIVSTDKGDYGICGELNIRYCLYDCEGRITKSDGKAADLSLLPSGFFTISTSKHLKNVVGYTLSGGGLGHGVGMSQNGANQLAKNNYTYSDILKYYYIDFNLRKIYE